MRKGRPETEDQRREWALWILYAREYTGLSVATCMERIAAAYVADHPAPTRDEATEYFALPRPEDILPTPKAWAKLETAVASTVVMVEANQEDIDAIIRAHSPRWRIERMPPIDRLLLRLGVQELKYNETPRARATLNGLIELGKKYGEDATPRFLNGILDQIRKTLGVPFK